MLLLKRLGLRLVRSENLVWGGNTLIKAKKNQSMRVDDLTETLLSVLNIYTEPKPLFFNMKNKFSGITGWD